MMKNKFKLIIAAVVFAVFALVFSGCNYTYTDGPNYPSVVARNSEFSCDFTLSITEGEDTYPGNVWPYNIGIKIPQSFASGGISNAISSFTITSTPPSGSGLATIDTTVVFDQSVVDILTSEFPPEPEYVWWGGTTSEDIYTNTNVTVTGELIFANSGAIEGDFNIGVAVYYIGPNLGYPYPPGPEWITDGESHSISVDGTPPSVSITSPTDGSFTTSPDISGTAYDGGTLDRVEVSLDGDPYVNAAGTTSWDHTFTTMSEGPHTVYARAYDKAGNVTTTAPVSFTYDIADPSVSISSPTEGSTTGSKVITGTASDTYGIDRVEVSLDNEDSYVTASGTDSWSYTFDTMEEGQRIVYARAYNTAGNESSTAEVTFTYVASPNIFSISPISGHAGTDVTILGSNFDIDATVKFGITTAEGISCVSSFELEATVPSELSAGIYDITVTNPSGESATLEAAFMVIATPIITVSPASFTFSIPEREDNPPDQSFSISNTGGGGILNWTVSENADWLTLNPPLSGTNFGIVTFSVDISGLLPRTYSAAITVTAPGASNSPLDIPVTLIVAEVLTIDTVSPEEGPVGLWIALNGRKFEEETIVKFGDIDSPLVDYIDSTELTALVPHELLPGTYDITAINPDGNEHSLLDAFTVTEGPTPNHPLNYPNPFDPKLGTTISFNLDKDTDTKVLIYNSTGRLIWQEQFFAGQNGGRKKPAVNNIPWNGKDMFGNYVANGPYLHFILVDGKIIGRGEMAVFK